MASSQLLLILTAMQFIGVKTREDSFAEELFIKRLKTGGLYAHSQFTTLTDIFSSVTGSHYNLFPKSFGQIVQKYDVAELHLTLTHGRWRHQAWGYPISSAPFGAELWVWFSPDLEKERVEKQWFGLVNALSGQFCASLNYLQKDVSVSPKYSFKPMGLWPSDKVNGTDHLRYAVLPRENVCTENLTPWKKLLPCESKAGISTLFNALHLYDASFHSLSIHLRSVCEDADCERPRLELKQTLSSVYDPAIADVRDGWSFGKIFGEILKSNCPLASTSKILIGLPLENEDYRLELDPTPSQFEEKVVDDTKFKYAVYDLKKFDFKQDLDLRAMFHNLSAPGMLLPPTLHAHRYTTGHGEEKGGVVSIISNEHATKNIKVIYFDVIPWYIPVYLHSLKVDNDGKFVKPDKLQFTPAKDRVRPTKMEMVLSIPPKSTLKLKYLFSRAFLKWTEHPPDSHHGFYIGSAVISAILPDASNLTGISERCSTISGSCIDQSPSFIRIHTESNLVVLPTPDFSMPYNVICLTCTIFAIGFGSMYNLATRSFIVVGSKDQTSLKDKLKAFIMKLFKSKTS